MASHRTFRKFLYTVLLTLLTIVFATSCRRQAVDSLPTALPMFTATPRSTPLPVIATAIPPGEKGNPLTIVLQAVDESDNAQSVIKDLEAEILKSAQLEVRIKLVDDEAQAVAALCSSTIEEPVIGWVNGVAVLAAQARNCARPLLQVERGKSSDATTGYASSIIVRRGIESFSALDGRIFCRLDVADPASWLIPSLMLQANGLNVTVDLKTIDDYPQIPDLVKAVANGKCDAAGIPDDAFDTFSEELQNIGPNVSVLATSPDFPFGVLMLPREISLGTQAALQETFLKLAKDRILGPKLKQLLGQDSFTVVSDTDFVSLNEFAVTTGLDFSQLGD